MIRERRTDAAGQVYWVWIPETEADVREIRRRASRGEIDDRASFGDDPRALGFGTAEIDPDDLEDVGAPPGPSGRGGPRGRRRTPRRPRRR